MSARQKGEPPSIYFSNRQPPPPGSTDKVVPETVTRAQSSMHFGLEFDEGLLAGSTRLQSCQLAVSPECDMGFDTQDSAEREEREEQARRNVPLASTPQIWVRRPSVS